MAKLLLEYVSQKLGCIYLSDLRDLTYHSAVIAILNDIPESYYPIRQWNDLLFYLTQNPCASPCQSKAEVLQALTAFSHTSGDVSNGISGDISADVSTDVFTDVSTDVST